MNLNGAAQWLRGLKRGYKLGLVLVAAWCPLVLSASPWLAGALMTLCTAAFFTATRSNAPATNSDAVGSRGDRNDASV